MRNLRIATLLGLLTWGSSGTALAQWDNLQFESGDEDDEGVTGRPGAPEADERPDLMVFDVQLGEGVTFEPVHEGQLNDSLDAALEDVESLDVLTDRERRQALTAESYVITDEPDDVILAEAGHVTRVERILIVRIEVADGSHYRVTAAFGAPTDDPASWIRAEQARVSTRLTSVQSAIGEVVDEALVAAE